MKEAIQGKSGIPADMIRLIAAGQVMDASKTIADYNLSADATLHLVLTMMRSSAPPAAPAPVAAPLPKRNEALEKCWSAAYCEEWDKAKSYLESGQVSLDELEQRTGRDLLVFFAERNMVDALAYAIAVRGKPPVPNLLTAVNISIKAHRGPVFQYLMDKVTSVAELQTVQGVAQPIHYAVRFGRVGMLRYLLD
ncbi:hypothetical protein EON64_19700, partial [archaeon]